MLSIVTVSSRVNKILIDSVMYVNRATVLESQDIHSLTLMASVTVRCHVPVIRSCVLSTATIELVLSTVALFASP